MSVSLKNTPGHARFMLLAAGVCFLLPLQVWAVNIKGTVHSEFEGPLKGAEVQLIDASRRVLVKSTLSDQQGQFQFSVDAGEYDLQVSKSKFAPAQVSGLRVAVDTVLDAVSLESTEWEVEAGTTTDEGCD